MRTVLKVFFELNDESYEVLDVGKDGLLSKINK
jgi:hypothetical protein